MQHSTRPRTFIPLPHVVIASIFLGGLGGCWIALQMESNSAIAPQSPQREFVPPPVLEDCDQNKIPYSGLYRRTTNTIYLCSKRIPTPAYRRFVLAHELGHAKKFQGGWAGDLNQSELKADVFAINYLLQQGDCEAVRDAASRPRNLPEYAQGDLYAQKMAREFCHPRVTHR